MRNNIKSILKIFKKNIPGLVLIGLLPMGQGGLDTPHMSGSGNFNNPIHIISGMFSRNNLL